MEESFRSVGHIEGFLSRLQKRWESGKLCDIVLVAATDGTRISAHKVVLSASCEYFSAKLTGGQPTSNTEEMIIQNVDGQILNLLIQFCYTGCINLNKDIALKLLSASTFLHLNVVVTACCEFLANQLHVSNCLLFTTIAEKYQCDSLLKQAQAFCCKHFIDVCQTEEFYQLNSIQLGQLLACDDINVTSEHDVFHSLMSWIQYDLGERDKHRAELLMLIRMPLLDPAFIIAHVQPICNSIESQGLAASSLRWHLMLDRVPFEGSDYTKPRVSMTLDHLLIAIRGGDNVKIESFCYHLNKWIMWKKSFPRNFDFGAAIMGNKLYFAGGRYRTSKQSLNTVSSINLKNMDYETNNSMQDCRTSPGVIELKDFLYAVGGFDASTLKFLNTVERYNPSTNTWCYVASMSAKRRNPGIAVLYGNLYAVGGFSGRESLSSVECFDSVRNEWSLKAPMNERRNFVGVTAANGYIYAVGGTADANTVERYNPGNDKWDMICSMSTLRVFRSCTCSSMSGRIIAVGVNDGSLCVEEYDPLKNEWKRFTSLSYRMENVQLLKIPNVIPSIELL